MPTTTLTTGLTSYWKFDESSGNAADSGGSGNTLTNTNSATFSAGRVNNAATLVRASSQYFSIASNSSLQTGDIDFSLAYWVKFATIPAGNLDCVMKRTGSGTQEYGSGYISANLQFRFIVFDAATGLTPTTRLATTFGTPTTGVWYFVVCRHDSVANTLSICVNNGTVDTTTSYITGVFAGTNNFTIGGRGDGTSTVDGQIDEFGFWKKVLTASEITTLYNGGNGLTYPFSIVDPMTNVRQAVIRSNIY